MPAEVTEKLRLSAFEDEMHIGYVCAIYLDQRRPPEDILARVDLTQSWWAQIVQIRDALHTIYTDLPTCIVASSEGAVELMNRTPRTDLGMGWVEDGMPGWVAEACRDQADASYTMGVRVQAQTLHGPAGERCMVSLQPPEPAWVSPLARLSARQLAVAERAAMGMTTPAIAEELAVSAETVKAHLRAVYERLDIASRFELKEAIEGRVIH